MLIYTLSLVLLILKRSLLLGPKGEKKSQSLMTMQLKYISVQYSICLNVQFLEDLLGLLIQVIFLIIQSIVKLITQIVICQLAKPVCSLQNQCIYFEWQSTLNKLHTFMLIVQLHTFDSSLSTEACLVPQPESSRESIKCRTLSLATDIAEIPTDIEDVGQICCWFMRIPLALKGISAYPQGRTQRDQVCLSRPPTLRILKTLLQVSAHTLESSPTGTRLCLRITRCGWGKWRVAYAWEPGSLTLSMQFYFSTILPYLTNLITRVLEGGKSLCLPLRPFYSMT